MLVVIAPRAQRDLERLERATATRVVEALERFAETGQGDVRRLRGVSPPEYRLRVGAWRVRFRYLVPGVLEVLRILPRGEAYR